jgi:ATP-dependent exoDNAse (exonuclease V) beta subunit
VVGTLVHTALRHWRFEQDTLEPFLRPFILEMGVVDETEIHAAAVEAKRLLRRFRAHPLWAEMDAAQRWHEVPVSIVEDGQAANGIVDLLYRAAGGGDAAWRIAEFKTDEIRSGQDLHAHIREQKYDEQVQRYTRAVGLRLGEVVEAALVFLNVGNEVTIVPIPNPGTV